MLFRQRLCRPVVSWQHISTSCSPLHGLYHIPICSHTLGDLDYSVILKCAVYGVLDWGQDTLCCTGHCIALYVTAVWATVCQDPKITVNWWFVCAGRKQYSRLLLTHYRRQSPDHKATLYLSCCFSLRHVWSSHMCKRTIWYSSSQAVRSVKHSMAEGLCPDCFDLLIRWWGVRAVFQMLHKEKYVGVNRWQCPCPNSWSYSFVFLIQNNNIKQHVCHSVWEAHQKDHLQ